MPTVNKFLLFVSCAAAVIADMLLVWYAKRPSHPMLAIAAGLVLVNAATLVWTYTMRHGIESATAITCYALFTVIGCSALGVLVFKERVSGLAAFGMALGLVSLVLMSYF